MILRRFLPVLALSVLSVSLGAPAYGAHERPTRQPAFGSPAWWMVTTARTTVAWMNLFNPRTWR